MTLEKILQANRGLIEAPAGCGKTFLISKILETSSFRKQILVLTHTHAGVAVIRQRADVALVKRSSYKLSTIDSWTYMLSTNFPKRSGYDRQESSTHRDHDCILECTKLLLSKKCISEILTANYSLVLVDEYQDCSILQHEIICHIADIIPTYVFGDPMQSVFSFKNTPTPDWELDVCKRFPTLDKLSTPWRWINKDNEPLGKWLLDQRKILKEGGRIDISTVGKTVYKFKLNGKESDYDIQRKAAYCNHKNPSETVLVIGDSANDASRHEIAKKCRPMVTIEPVEMSDFISFAEKLDIGSKCAVEDTIEFASRIMTNVNRPKLFKRLKSIAKGKNRKIPTAIEELALAQKKRASHTGIANLLSAFKDRLDQSVHVYRPQIYYATICALNKCNSTGVSFLDAAKFEQDKLRRYGRSVPQHGIGSTLLLKGLEADHVVILNADKLDSNNLYVAMTRGAKSVTICSKSDTLPSGSISHKWKNRMLPNLI